MVAAASPTALLADAEAAHAALRDVDAQLARGKRKVAARLAEQALAFFQQAGSKREEAESLAKLGVAQLRLNKLDQAAHTLGRATLAYGEAGDRAGQAISSVSLAALEHSRGNVQVAMQHVEDARKHCEHAGGGDAAADGWDRLVALHVHLQTGKAVDLARQDLSARRRAKDAKGQELAERRLISACLGLGDDEGALQAARKACQRLFKAGDLQGQATMLRLAAELHLRGGRAELALHAAKDALALLRAAAGPGGLLRSEEAAAVQTTLAEAYLAKGETPPLTASRAEALATLGELGNALQMHRKGAIDTAQQKLQAVGGLARQDLAAALGSLAQKDPSVEAFIAQNMPTSEIVEDPASKEQVARLRQFPASPAEGESKEGARWVQTMGHITLSFALADGKVQAGAVSVQLSACEMQVSIGGTKVDAMCGVLSGPVLFGYSWWKLHVQEGSEERRATLVVQLVKQEHKAWTQLWFSSKGELAHPMRRGRFYHTEDMYHAKRAEEEQFTLAVLRQGTAAESGQMRGEAESEHQLAPDDLCVGLEVSQNEAEIAISVHLEGEAVSVAQRSITLEELFAADVFDDRVSIHLRGGEHSPILLAQLQRKICPELTTWRLTTSDTFRCRQREPSAPAPVLLVTLVKSVKGRWPAVFTRCYQHRLMIKNYGEYEMLVYTIQADLAARERLAARRAARQPNAATEDEGSEGGGAVVAAEEEGGSDEGDDECKQLQAALLTEEQREGLQQRLDAWREERFEGLPGALPVQRGRVDFQDPDYTAYVGQAVEDIMARTGSCGRPRWDAEVGRYTYVY